jgi:hypothetical protein
MPVMKMNRGRKTDFGMLKKNVRNPSETRDTSSELASTEPITTPNTIDRANAQTM